MTIGQMTKQSENQIVPENVKCLSSRVKKMIVESFAAALTVATNDPNSSTYDKLVNSIVFDSTGTNRLKSFKVFSNDNVQFVALHLTNYNETNEVLAIASVNNIVSAYNNNLASSIPVSMITYPRETYVDIEYEVFTHKENIKFLTLNVKAIKSDATYVTNTYYIDIATMNISVSDSLQEFTPFIQWEKLDDPTDEEENGENTEIETPEQNGGENIVDQPNDDELPTTGTDSSYETGEQTENMPPLNG
jgi:hypothetical protein